MLWLKKTAGRMIHSPPRLPGPAAHAGSLTSVFETVCVNRMAYNVPLAGRCRDGDAATMEGARNL